MASYLINMNDGRLVFRNSETDKHINLKPVSNEIVKMIVGGEVSTKDVISAITAKMREDGSELTADEYYKEKMKLNVRKTFVDEDGRVASLADRSSEEVSIDEINAVRSRGDDVKKAERKERIKKINKELDSAAAADALSGL